MSIDPVSASGAGSVAGTVRTSPPGEADDKFGHVSVSTTREPGGCLGSSQVSLETIFSRIYRPADVEAHRVLTDEIDFNAYIERGFNSPNLFRTSSQRIYDMILSKGRKPIELDGETIYVYEFFKDTVDPEDSISGLERPLHDLVEVIGGSAKQTGPNRRVILLAGPVGSAKTSIARAIARGLEGHSRTPEGEIRALKWDLRGEDGEPLKDKNGKLLFKHVDVDHECEIFEDPINVVPLERRRDIFESLNTIRREQAKRESKQLDYLLRSDCRLCPKCQDIYDTLDDYYEGDTQKILRHVKAQRLVLNLQTRTGLTFFGAKDEKSHNAAELSGGVNMRRLLQIGTDSHPQAITLDGDVLRANRGMVHFGEVLKFPKEITYPLLDGAQDRNLKVTKQALVDFDTFMIATTNVPDWKRILRDEFQEAMRSRIYPITIPYLDNVEKEAGIYEKTFSRACRELGIHEAPHGRYIAALWGLTTRLADPTRQNVTMIQKALLYSGKHLKGFNEQEVIQMKKDVPEEEMELLKGISPRDIQDALAKAMEHPDVQKTNCVSPFLVIDELEGRLKQPIVNVTSEDRKKFLTRLREVEKELDKKLLDDVRRAVSGDERELQTLHDNYIMHVRGFVRKEKVKDPITKRDVEPNEQLMQSVENKLGITETRRTEFRRGLMEQIADLALDSKEFRYDTNEDLKRAYEEVLLEKHKDVTLPTLSTEFANQEQLQKIETVKGRLIEKLGYCPNCAKIAMRRAQSPENRGPSN